MTAPSHAKWAAGMKALHQEAAGALELWPVLASDVPAIVREAFGGSADALRILDAVSGAIEQIKSTLPELPLCGCCWTELADGQFSFCVVQPAGVPNPSSMMTLAICNGCGADAKAVQSAAVRALQSLWPEARPVALTPNAGGRA